MTACYSRAFNSPSLSVRSTREEPVQAFDVPSSSVSRLSLKLDAGAGNEVAHNVRHQDFAAEGMAGDARRVMDGRAEEVVGFVKRVAGVDSDPDADRRRDGQRMHRDRALDRCAHATARRALGNASIDPSPCVSTTVPPCAAVASSMIAWCRRRRSSQAWSPRRASKTVESTMSVKTIVTVPSESSALERSGFSRWTARSSSSIVSVNDLPRTSTWGCGK